MTDQFTKTDAEIDKSYDDPRLKPVADPAQATPAAQWRVDGKEDPHGARYDCERNRLMRGELSDDELANTVFIYPNIVNLTAAKDRIRWLSRALERELERARKADAEVALVRAALANMGEQMAAAFAKDPIND